MHSTPNPPEKTTSLPAFPQSYPPPSNLATLIFLPPSSSLGRKSAPHPWPRVPEAVYNRQELKGIAQPSWQKHLWVCGVPPPGQWGGEKTGPSPGAGSEVHAPGGLTDARGRQSRERGDRNRCWEGNGFFVSLLCLDFFSVSGL